MAAACVASATSLAQLTEPLACSPPPHTLQVVWVSGLFDLNRKDLTEFKRPMTEYFSRFNRILDRGFEMVLFIPEVRLHDGCAVPTLARELGGELP